MDRIERTLHLTGKLGELANENYDLTVENAHLKAENARLKQLVRYYLWSSIGTACAATAALLLLT